MILKTITNRGIYLAPNPDLIFKLSLEEMEQIQNMDDGSFQEVL